MISFCKHNHEPATTSIDPGARALALMAQGDTYKSLLKEHYRINVANKALIKAGGQYYALEEYVKKK